MNRLNTIFIAVGAAAAFAPPGQAQSGHALAVAEQACLGKHIKPYTNAFNICVNDTARAYDYGELLTARDTCLSCGLNPQTLSYRQCVADKQARAPVVVTTAPRTTLVQTYRVHPDPTDPQYHEEYVVPSRVSYRY
ncbi:MAG: hypothetical protein EPO10_20255 [Reyranella sp.]|uniref:hypothetical protein n=1 Tax=Reyranella sp. TaxID=1929291 RepID=UPI0011FCEF64|nr:hypothetical protein [Reyranella sp.]TAJ98038.1 MAG: hypothetical protein EPO41_00825 [Reyranella sp.]TBR27018.1 MAG: hypothetical protein EPO10_20255 [Reyranella sp.]